MTKIIPLYPHLSQQEFAGRKKADLQPLSKKAIQYDLMRLMRAILPLRLSNTGRVKGQRPVLFKLNSHPPYFKQTCQRDCPGARSLQMLENHLALYTGNLYRTVSNSPLPGEMLPGRA